MRSSLRKTNYATVANPGGGSSGFSSNRTWNLSSGGGGTGGSVGDTSTNPTPPDSMHSEDSSYVSAKDISSQHSSTSALRVRFSPVAASVSSDGRTLIDVPILGQNLNSTAPLKATNVHNSVIGAGIINTFFCGW